MNDSDKQDEGEPDGSMKKGQLSAIKSAAEVIRDCLVKMGVPSGWGTLIAAFLGAGMAVFISLSSAGCHSMTSWNMEGKYGSLLVERDPSAGAIIISGKRNFSIDGEKK